MILHRPRTAQRAPAVNPGQAQVKALRVRILLIPQLAEQTGRSSQAMFQYRSRIQPYPVNLRLIRGRVKAAVMQKQASRGKPITMVRLRVRLLAAAQAAPNH